MRKITALAAAAALIAGLTACGSTAVENTATSTPTRTVTYKIDGEWLYEYSPGVYRPSIELCRTSTRQCDPNFPGGASVTYVDSLGLEQHNSDGWLYPTERTFTMSPGDTAAIKATSAAYPVGWVECTILIDGRVVDRQRDENHDQHTNLNPRATCTAPVV